MSTCNFSHLVFDKDAKTCDGKKQTSLTNVARKNECPHEEE